MSSSIEEIINEMERYIDENAKPATFSPNKIVINRDRLEDFITDLKQTTPEELRRYQKIINNRDAIIADAKAKADDIINKTNVEKNKLLSEHEIMQQAYAQANQVVLVATKNAQELLDKAQTEANEVKMQAIQYTDGLLESIQAMLETSIETTRTRDEAFLGKLNGVLTQVVENRSELSGSNNNDSNQENAAVAPEPEKKAEKEEDKVPEINVSENLFKN